MTECQAVIVPLECILAKREKKRLATHGKQKKEKRKEDSSLQSPIQRIRISMGSRCSFEMQLQHDFVPQSTSLASSLSSRNFVRLQAASAGGPF